MTELRPRVSAVIPAYNYGRYLSGAVDSVLRQTETNLECIVVDDGSTDDTPEVVGAIRDSRLRYVRQVNGGLSSARNTGIRDARGEYIGFLDADDRWLPGFVERGLQEFATLPSRHAAVATAAQRIDADGKQVAASPFSFGRTGDLTFRDFCLRNRPLSSNILIRRVALQECGWFDERLRSSEDRDYWLRLTAAGWGFRFLDEPLAEIRRHSANMSKAAARMRANTGDVLRRARQAGIIHRHSPFWWKVDAARHLQSARTFHAEGASGTALKLLALSWVRWPFYARPSELSEPSLFRLRTLARILLDLTGRARK
jgi:glycosyltransferase involved in cell wall biosynthesis